MRYQGRITTWNDDKGFGFITPNGGGKQIFVHINSFSNRQRRPTGNEIVTYELKTDDRNRIHAGAVAFVGEQASLSVAFNQSSISLLFACCFLIVIMGAVLMGRLPKIILAIYGVTSLITILIYAMDKSAAQNSRWRTQESTLHLLALLGGWIGALAAQRLLRHKSRKTSFQTVFWITVFLNCVALGWFFSSSSANTLRFLLGV